MSQNVTAKATRPISAALCFSSFVFVDVILFFWRRRVTPPISPPDPVLGVSLRDIEFPRMTNVGRHYTGNVRRLLALVTISIVFVPIYLTAFSSARADSARPFDIAEFILSVCHRSIDDISRVETLARIRDWTPVPPDKIGQLRPKESDSFQAWTVKYNGIGFIISVNLNQSSRPSSQVCTVIVNSQANEVIDGVLRGIKIAKSTSKTERGKSLEYYQLSAPSNVILVIGRDTGETPNVNFSFVKIKP